MNWYCAPMEGITGRRFRVVHHKFFPGASRYYMPFISPDHNHRFTPRERRELAPERNEGVNAVPQVLTRSAEDFLWAAEGLFGMGWPEVNLNLGCPSGTVAAKGKGAGFLGRPAELERFLEQIFSKVKGRVSIKTRLGVQDPEEFWPVLALYARYPIAELIIHPRVQKDFYKVPVRPGYFARAAAEYPGPLCYNGDLFRQKDCETFAGRFPGVRSVMLGRGLAADPALIRKLTGGPPADREELRAFHDALYEGYRADFGSERNAILRMKELWTYLIHLFGESARLEKRLKKSVGWSEYQAAVDAIFQELELLPGLPGREAPFR